MKKNIEFISNFNLVKNKKLWKTALRKKNVQKIREISSFVDNQNLADWIEEQKPELQIFFIRSLQTIKASEVFNLLDDKTTENIIRKFTKAETKKLVSLLYTDDIVDVIEELPSELVSRVLESITEKQRRDVNYILNYPEDSVGSVMNVDLIKIRLSTSVSSIIQAISSREKSKISQNNRVFYVTDNDNILVGFVTLEALLSHEKNSNLKVSQIFENRVISLRALDDKEIVLQKVNKYKISEFPVVDGQNKLVGVLDAEASFEIVQTETSEDASITLGVSPLKFDEDYFKVTAFRHFLKRMPWLFLTIIISSLSQIVLALALNNLDINSVENKWLIEIIPYLPFLLALVGNIALQSGGVVSKYIVLGQIKKGNYWKTIFKEMKVLFFTLSTVLIFSFARKIIFDLFTQDFKPTEQTYWVSTLVLLSVLIVSVSFTVLLSATLPIIAAWKEIDPVIMSSPLLTATVDVVVTVLVVAISALFLLWFAQ